MPGFSIRGKLVDVFQRQVIPAEIKIQDGVIASVDPVADAGGGFLLPGFVDAHVHIESSMLVPSEFARAAVRHGTVATVSDPHEIGNVLGRSGVDYMLDNAAQVPFKFYFGAPSCVPATSFETAGATISVDEVGDLLDDPRILYLSEMMNFPGVLHGDREVLAKISAARQRGKPIDGHAPGLRGEDAARYIAAGPSTDHECFTREEALDKLAAGGKISIREGSAARNFAALSSLLTEYPQATMLCSDDKHPDELLEGHINSLVRRAVAGGVDLFDALRAACVNPVEHYGLDVGLLREGDPADLIEVDSLTDFHVRRTWIDGQLVSHDGKTTIPRIEPEVVNQFVGRTWSPEEFAIAASPGNLRVIEAIDGQLVTNCLRVRPRIVERKFVSDPDRDILKIVVVNRYRQATPAIGFAKNFGLQQGAMASSVAHDSHNIIAVGVTEEAICEAVNLVSSAGGGLAVAAGPTRLVLPLPVAGLMATGTCEEVATSYGKLDQEVKRLGSKLRAPFMTLSFMALLVIPSLKLSDLGLFDGEKFQFVPLCD